MMTDVEEKKLFNMVTEIYHHLGLDGQRPVNINQLKINAEKDVLNWKGKKDKKEYELKKT